MLACLEMLQSLLVKQQMWSIWLQSNIALSRASIASIHADKVMMHTIDAPQAWFHSKFPASQLLTGTVQTLLISAMQMVLRWRQSLM